jgi:hypothetical protein
MSIGRFKARRSLASATLCALLLSVACAPAEPTTVSVIIPATRDGTVGCIEPAREHELIEQRAILCRPDVRARFVLFSKQRPRTFAQTILSDAASDAVALPFEMCPEAVSSALRAQIEHGVARIVARGGIVVAATGNRGSLACAGGTSERFPADVPRVISVGAGSQDRPSYTLRWHGKPDYYVSWDNETLGSAGTSFAAARFVLWRFNIRDIHVIVTKSTARDHRR